MGITRYIRYVAFAHVTTVTAPNDFNVSVLIYTSFTCSFFNIQKEEQHSNTTLPKSEKYHTSLLNYKQHSLPIKSSLSDLRSLSGNYSTQPVDSHNSTFQNKANSNHAQNSSVEKHNISDADDPTTLTESQSNQNISSGVFDDMAQLNSQLPESYDNGNFKQANYKNVVLKPSSSPPVPPKGIKKSPSYGNQEIDTSQKMAPKSSDSLPFNIGQQSSQQPSQISVESQKRLGTL